MRWITLLTARALLGGMVLALPRDPGIPCFEDAYDGGSYGVAFISVDKICDNWLGSHYVTKEAPLHACLPYTAGDDAPDYHWDFDVTFRSPVSGPPFKAWHDADFCKTQFKDLIERCPKQGGELPAYTSNLIHQ